jgi:hypothetical protein
MHVIYGGIGSYRPFSKCPFCQCHNDSDPMLSIEAGSDTHFCWECKALCLLEPGLQAEATAWSDCAKPDCIVPVTPITRISVYRHKLAREDEEWFSDDEDFEHEDVKSMDGDEIPPEAVNPNYTLVEDKTFASPVWDVTTLLRGDPPLIVLGNTSILWDDKGRPRHGYWYSACQRGGVPL